MLFYSINSFILITLLLIFFVLMYMVRESNKRKTKLNDYLYSINKSIKTIDYGKLDEQIKNLASMPDSTVTTGINQLIDNLKSREKAVIAQQEELVKLNKLLEAILNSLSDGLVVLDEEYNILRTTPKVLQWFELKSQNISRHKITEYIEPLDEDVPIEKFENSEIILRGNPNESFEASTLKIIGEDKQQKFIIIIRDTTNEKALGKLKEDFAMTLTHDLKVPIIAESNIIELLLKEKFGDINEKQKEALKNMQVSNLELIELVQTLLDTYKLKETGIELYIEKVSLPELINTVVEEMRSIAQGNGISIKIVYNPAINIMLDKFQIKRVLKNLIQNAIQHSDTSKQIDITVKTDENNAYISVIDYGKGISKEDIEKVFKKYYSTARKFRKIGTGLGLYLSQQIVKAHKGEITIYSKTNTKTDIRVRLPLKQ